jgi:hypothetical protein
MTSAQTRGRESLTSSQQQWLRVRSFLGDYRYELGRAARAEYPGTPSVGPTPLLGADRWMLPAPVRLDEIALELAPTRRGIGADQLAKFATPIVLPERPDGSRYASYAAAITDLTDRAFDDRGTYRLLGGELSSRGSKLEFGLGTYFDSLNVGEACAHEFAATRLGLLPPNQQRMRAAVGDACDPARRPTNVAISTLTLRLDRSSGRATFPLHWRDPKKVGHAAGLYHVLPTGVFQAASKAQWNLHNDFSLWRSMVREYAEELLGESEDYGAEVAPINYDAWPFAAAMTRGLNEGAVSAYALGLGVDPLTLATDLLTMVIIEADFYDELFNAVVGTNAEGEIVTSAGDGESAAYGVPFTHDVVCRFVQEDPTQAAGAALLWLAWEHRHSLFSK